MKSNKIVKLLEGKIMEEEAYLEQETILIISYNYNWTDGKIVCLTHHKKFLISHIFSYGSFVAEENHKHRN